MISNVEFLARQKGINSPQELCWAAKMSWPTAKEIWSGNIAKKRLENMHKVAMALGCKVDDLYTAPTP